MKNDRSPFPILLAALLCLAALPAQWNENCLQTGDSSSSYPSPGEVNLAVQQSAVGTTVTVSAGTWAMNPAPWTCGDIYVDTGTYTPVFCWGFPLSGGAACGTSFTFQTNTGAGWDQFYIDPATMVTAFPTASATYYHAVIPPCSAHDLNMDDHFYDAWTYTSSPSTLGVQLLAQVVRYDSGLNLWFVSNVWEGFLL